MLRVELEELRDLDFDLDLTGFDETEINALFEDADDTEVEDDDFDLTAALEEAAFVMPGDVWTLGRHRLICGDATDADTVKRLMDGRKANLVLTDPPYNVSFESGSGLKIQNDSMKSEQFFNFLLASFRNLADNLESGGSAYIFHADTEGENFRRGIREAGFHLSGTCIWAKDSFVMGRSPYQWQHEPILFGWLKTGTHKWYAGEEATIWNFPKPKRNDDHPTSKPIDLLAYPLGTAASQTASYLIPLAARAALIACEQTDRICHMLEIDIMYASVILRRFATLKTMVVRILPVNEKVKALRYTDLVKEVARK